MPSFTEADGELHANGPGLVPGVTGAGAETDADGAGLVPGVTGAGAETDADGAGLVPDVTGADAEAHAGEAHVALLDSAADTEPIPAVTDTKPGAAPGTIERGAVPDAADGDLVSHQGAAPQSETGTASMQASVAEADEPDTGAKRPISRRAMIQAAMIGGAGVASLPLLALVGNMGPTAEPQPTNATFSLNGNWLFGGVYQAGSEISSYDDSSFAPITLPHTVTTLSWRYWNFEAWQRVWIYRRHFDGGLLVRPHPPGNRIFVDFDGVMVNAIVMINDQVAGNHQGGYLPFSAELTSYVTEGENLLAVVVDARCLPVPPISSGQGPESIDYYQPGGIYRDISLRVVPQAFLSDLFALPADVLSSDRRVDVECTIDSALTTRAVGTLLVTLLDGSTPITSQVATVILDSPGISTTKLSLTGLGPISLWSPDNPKLYTVQATLAIPGVGSHVITRQIGFREASFQPDGFYLNGERLQLFGLDRHQLFPYAGMAMPARVQRKDVEILRNELNCNMVRCSHYPQSPHFLDACDQLGLLVWEEAPGWHDVSYDPAWQDLVVQNVRDMVTRDRSRPSVIIWGTRLNETRDVPGLWAATRQAAAQLDGSRPSSGAMTHHTQVGWDEDIFAFDDYSHNLETDVVELKPPLPGVPYIVTEAVGVQETMPRHFTWADPSAQLARQATLHAQAQSLARSDPGYSGMLAWAAFDYYSFQSQDSDGVKWAGVADGFRIPKPGAAMYQSQVDPGIRPVIVPAFFWDIEQPQPESSASPGQHQASGQHGRFVPPPGGGSASSPTVLIASNCEQLKIFIGGVYLITALPAADSPLYRHLPYPPFLVGIPSPAPDEMPDLLIEGYVGGQQVAEIRMSSDPTGDAFVMTADDAAIYADGSDATRAVFRAVDAYGNQRRHPSGEVTLTLTGPARLVGDSPFDFGVYGGLGAVWIRSLAGQPGAITLTATHPELGTAQAHVRSLPASRTNQLV